MTNKQDFWVAIKDGVVIDAEYDLMHLSGRLDIDPDITFMRAWQAKERGIKVESDG